MLRMLRGVIERVRALLPGFDSDMEQEFQFHIEQATARNEARGMSPEVARRRAVQAFGSVEIARARVESETGVLWLRGLGHDLRHSVRGMRRHPLVAGIVIGTVAVVMAANAAVFSVVYSILLKPLPFPDSDRLVALFNAYPDAGQPRGGNSVPDRFDRRDYIEALEDVALYSETSHTLGQGDAGRHTFAIRATPSFFDVLRAEPAIGHLFDAATTAADGRVVVLGDAIWHSRFGADPSVVGTRTTVDGAEYTIVGVLPPEFRFSTWDAQLFTPLLFGPEARSDEARHNDSFQMVGRLAVDATVAGAQAEIDAFNEALVASYPADTARLVTEAGYRTVVRDYLGDVTREVRLPLLFLWVGVGLIFAIAAANVVSVVLVQTRARSDELAARMALGAGRPRLLRMLVTESVVLVGIGTGVGVVVAAWSLRLLERFAVYEIPRVDDVSIDGVVLAVTGASALLLAAAAGAVPAVALSRSGPLTHHARAATAPASRGSHRVLVGAQVALAFVLIMSAGLLASSIRNLLSVPIGFEPESVVAHAVSLPSNRYPDAPSRSDYVDRLNGRLASLPGVSAAAVASQLPFSGSGGQRGVTVEDAAEDGGGPIPLPYYTAVSEDYFAALGIPLLAGRGFLTTDGLDSPRVAVVDQVAASALWPEGEAVGRRFWFGGERLGDSDAYTVVGVVGSILQESLAEENHNGAVYTSTRQRPRSFFRVAVKIDGDRASVWPSVRATFEEVDASVPYFWTDTLDDSVASSLLLQRTPMQFVGAFALLGLFLGFLGVYGVVAYSVGSRRAEIGLRMAIGSSPSSAAVLVGREGLVIVAVGVLTGAVGSWFVARGLERLLFETGPFDPTVFLIALTCVAGAALVACAGPLRQAVTIDPATTLRGD